MAAHSWHTGLFGCFGDCPTCCYVCWCPCFAYGGLRSELEGGGSCWPCCLYCLTIECCVPQCCLGPRRRKTLRTKYGLPAEPCGDCCVHFWCHPCGLCQDLSEYKRRKRIAEANPVHV